jgi:hypothetical protein
MYTRLLVERMVRAFLAAAIATLAAGINNNPNINADGARALAVGAIAAGISACLSMVSQFAGDPRSTSFLPSVRVEEQP